MIPSFSALRLWYYLENDIKFREIKAVHKPWYKDACKKVTRLLLSSTEKDDHDLVKEKTNENIATAWFELLQKYEDSKTERCIRIMEKILTLKPGESDQFMRQLTRCARILIKNIDSIDDFAMIMVVGKLNLEFPSRYRGVEDLLKESIERVTIDDLERKIVEVERLEEENRKHNAVKDRENASSSDDSIDNYVSTLTTHTLTKKDSLNLKQLFERQFAAKAKDAEPTDAKKQPAKEPVKLQPKSEKHPGEKQSGEGHANEKSKEDAPADAMEKATASVYGVNEPAKEESSVKVEEKVELNVPKSSVSGPEQKKGENSDKKPEKKDEQASKEEPSKAEPAKGESSKGELNKDESKSESGVKAVDSLLVTNFETTKIDLEDSAKFEQKKTPTDVSLSSYLANPTLSDEPAVSSTIPAECDSLAFFQNIKNVKSLQQIKESKISDSKSLEMSASTPTNPLPDAKQATVKKADDKKEPPVANPKHEDDKPPAVEKTKSDSKSLRLASSASDNSAASRVTLKMLDFMTEKDKEAKSISQYIDPKEIAKLNAKLREAKPPSDQPEKPKSGASPFDTAHPNLSPNVNTAAFEKLSLGTGVTPPTSLSSTISSEPTSGSSSPKEESDDDTFLSFKNKKNFKPQLLDPKVDVKLESAPEAKIEPREAKLEPKEAKLERPVKIEPALESAGSVKVESKVERPVKIAIGSVKTERPERTSATERDTFHLLETLPINVLRLLFLQMLNNSDIISFINAHRKCQNLANSVLQETVVASQNFNSNEPFLLKLFHSKEHVNHENVITDGRVLNLHLKNYTHITYQIKKLVTNEIGESIQTYANLEHLEILEPNETVLDSRFSETGFSVNLRYLKVLSVCTAYPGSFVFTVKAPNLVAVKLVNFRFLKLSQYESVTCLDVDEYDHSSKFVSKFPNLLQLYCTNLDSQIGLLRKDSPLRLIQLVHVERGVLLHLLKRKKACNLPRLKIVVQGVKVDGMNQTIIMRDLTTYFGEMRIYVKYQRRLVTLDFLSTLVVNFDLKCLTKSLLDKMTNLESLEVNFLPTDLQRWMQLLRASKVLKSISISVPIRPAFLDALPEACPHCMNLSLLYPDQPIVSSLKFIGQLTWLTCFQIHKELATRQVLMILQYRRLRFLRQIKFYYGHEWFEISYNRATSIVSVTYRNCKLLINKQDFRRQLVLAEDWSWFYRNNFPLMERSHSSSSTL